VKQRTIASGLAAVFALLGAAAWFAVSGSTGSTAMVSTVRQGQVHAAFHASGQLAYKQQVRLSAELIAKVLRIDVAEGQTVKPGQVLIQLDDAPVRAEISQAQAQLARSQIEIARLERDLQGKQRELERAVELAKQGMVSREKVESAEVAADSARFLIEAGRKVAQQDEAVLVQRQRMLERTVIRSPISGTVVAIPIRLGETAVASAQSMAGSELIHIADTNSMRVEAQVSENDLARVRVGQTVQVMLPAIPNQVFVGKVAQKARGISAGGESGRASGKERSARAVPVMIALEAGHDQFISGLTCDLQFQEGGAEGALLIPLTALRYEDEQLLNSMDAMMFGARRQPFVWVLSEGQARKRKLVLGVADEQFHEVQSGLKIGESVISGPPALLAKLSEGMAVSGGVGVKP
jgi:HlyD family secretion protein